MVWRVFLLFLVVCSAVESLWAADRKPNVVFVLTDDQRWDTISLHERSQVKTPNIDRLGTEGFYFRNSFCTTSLCSPSRASILSGLYGHSHGVQNNFTEYPNDLPSFPRTLQAAGYATGYIGKYHMGEENDEKRPGFDYFVTHKGQGKYFDTEFNVDGERKVLPGYYTHVVTDLAEKWIRKSAASDKPFLLILGHKAPHSFYFPEPKYEHSFDNVDIQYPPSAFMLADKPKWFLDRLDTWHGIYGPLFEYRKQFPDRRPEAVKDFAAMTRGYWGTILSVDDSVARLYAALKETGQLDNTLFIFTGDNGLLNGEHGMVDKRTMHEPSIRTPLVVRYPGLGKGSGGTVDQQVLTIDFAPSILDICGAKPLPKTHGASWKKLLQGDATGWRTSWYYEYNYEQQFPYTPNVRGVRTDRYKYIHYPHGDGGPDRHMAELYDLKSDPDEAVNLISKPDHAKTVVELQQELQRLMAAADGLPDKMPLDEGIKSALPAQTIR